MTDELESHIAAIAQYLNRHGVDSTSLEPPSGDPRSPSHAALMLNQETCV